MIRAPPTTSECPLMYFVSECRTTSAPCKRGAAKYGEEKVLSTKISGRVSTGKLEIRRAERAEMSIRRRVGFVGDSIHMRRVFGLMASRICSADAVDRSRNVVLTP